MHLNTGTSGRSIRSSRGDDVTSATELRHLPSWALHSLARMLDSSKDMWDQFAALIPNLDKDGEPLLSYDNIRCLENLQVQPSSSPGMAILKHWGISGRKRPTVADLLDVFVKMQYYRAADFVSQELLKGEATFSASEESALESSMCAQLSLLNTSTEMLSPQSIPAVQESCSQKYSDNSTNNQLSNDSSSRSSKTEDKKLPSRLNNNNESVQPHQPPENAGLKENVQRKIAGKSSCRHNIPYFKYNDLYLITKHFNPVPLKRGGSKLGEGAFGEVYLGIFKNGQAAVKRLKGSASKQFDVELEVLTRYKHENLLPLIGYSSDGPAPCLIYEYIENGSLQQHLDWKQSIPKIKPLNWISRISIAVGVARGIVHLHTHREPPLVHRDIKSANILLTNQLVPKVADFGLARIGESGLSTTITVTHTISGTSVYMAQEAFKGDVSVKLDTYSYGVVLLELLTGLYPYDPSREDRDLVSHMQCNCTNIVDMLDKAAGKWNTEKAKYLFGIATSCIEGKKKLRPTVQSLIPDLEALQQ